MKLDLSGTSCISGEMVSFLLTCATKIIIVEINFSWHLIVVYQVKSSSNICNLSFVKCIFIQKIYTPNMNDSYLL